MIRLVLNHDHLDIALGSALASCRHRLFIATADVKNLHLSPAVLEGGRAGDRGRKSRQRQARSILEIFSRLSGKGIEIRLLHGGVPSGVFLGELKEGKARGLAMRRCPRMHMKAVIADGRRMYLGSANLTGAGLGAKSPRRRNFEAGIWTDELSLIDPVLDMLERIWEGAQCPSCGRKANCPVPLEEPKL